MKNRIRKRIVLVFAVISMLALGACSTNNKADADQLIEVINTQITTVNQVIEHTNSKHEWMNHDDATDEAVIDGINVAIFEMETGRIRVDTQLRALTENAIVVNRDKVVVDSLVSDHEVLIQTIWTLWGELSDELVYMANIPVLSETYDASLEKANAKALEVVESLTALLDELEA